MRIELMTPSLPRKCSTPELRRLVSWQCAKSNLQLAKAYNKSPTANCQLLSANCAKSGRPGSNRPPEAWKATALPNELLPLINMQMGKCANMQIKRTTNRICTSAYWHICKFCFVGRVGFEPTYS
jgi:hypothetical protein